MKSKPIDSNAIADRLVASSDNPDYALLVEAAVEIRRLVMTKGYMKDWRDEWAKRHNSERTLADRFSEFVQHSARCTFSSNKTCSCGLTDLVEQWERMRS